MASIREIHSNVDVKETIRTLANETYIISFLFYFQIEYATLDTKWAYIIKYN